MEDRMIMTVGDLRLAIEGMEDTNSLVVFHENKPVPCLEITNIINQGKCTFILLRAMTKETPHG